MMKTFLFLTMLFFSLLLACNSPKSEKNTQSTDIDSVSRQENPTPDEVANTVDTANEYADKAVLNLIQVETPLPNEEIQTPLTIKGQARGTWYFEAEFKVLLKDKDDNILAQSQATAQGPWMTEDFVPFEAILHFDAPHNKRGELVLQKANSSSLAEYEKSYTIPILFPPEN